MKRALIAILLCTPAYAGELAKCDNGKCWMAESDYRRLQEYHKAAREALLAVEAEQARHQASTIRLLNELNACRSRQPEKEI